MKRLAAALSLLALSGALVFPSAAAPFGLGQSDAITQDVSLAPTTAPNGDYAYLDENDELVVDLSPSNPNLTSDAEGVNPDSVTTISNVFRVHYNGSRYAHVWITDESDAVTFVVDGDPIQSEATNVTLGPNESVAVGVVVDTTGEGGDGFVDDIDVHTKVADPEDVGTVGTQRSDDSDDESAGAGTAVQSFAPSPTERSITVVNAPSEEPTEIDLNAMRLDDDADSRANLTLDSVTLVTDGSTTISLDLTAASPTTSDVVGVASLGTVEVTDPEKAVSSATLRFSVSRAYLDGRDIQSDDLTVFRRSDGETSTLPVRIVDASGERVVFEADTPGFSTFTVAAVRQSIGVAEASLSAESVTTNESTTVTARVVNDGRAAGTRTVTLTLAGDAVAEQTVDLGANESTTVTFEVAPDTAGEFAVAVDGTAAGTLVVEDAGAGNAPGDAGTATGAVDDDAVGTATPVREPAGFGLLDVGGLVLATALVASLFVLARRVAR